MPSRKVARELPPVIRGRGRVTYKWDEAALNAKQQYDKDPTLWVLAGEAVPATQINALRLYTVEPFVTDAGRIEVSMRNSFKGADGRRYGDCWVHWLPKGEQPEDGVL